MPLGSAIVAAGAALAGDAANAAFTGARNRKAYERSVEFWNMQNAYNDPQRQMERFKNAGLNPNLIYGNGTSTTAGPPSVPSVEAPQVNLPRAVSSYFDTQTRSAQIDNLKAQNTVLLEEAALKRAQTNATNAVTPLREFDLGFKTEMRDTNADYRKEELRSKQLGNTFQSVKNYYQSAREQVTLDSIAQDVVRKEAETGRIKLDSQRLDQVIDLIRKDNDLKAQELELRRQGITSHDEIYWRVLAKYLSKLGIGFSD